LISAGLCLMVAGTAAVALALGLGAASGVVTAVVIAHGAIVGAANGVAITAMWDCLRRGISTARRGVVLGFTFGIGPLFAGGCSAGARSASRSRGTTRGCSPPSCRCCCS